MRSMLLRQEEDLRTYVVIFHTGDEVVSNLTQFAADYDLSGSHFTAVGACSDLVVGYYDWETKDYKKIPINEQVEVLMLSGDIGLENGGHKVHAHIVVSKSDATAHGGHLLEAHVRPTLEMIVEETPKHLVRKYDEESQLTLIAI